MGLALILGLAALTAVAQAPGSALADGERAYARGDYAGAARLWRPLAEQGDRDAQFALGTLYQSGRGVEQSDAAATQWFERAARQGSVPAQFNLGNAYKRGRGVAADDAAAFHWWLKAARAGLAPAQFNVGTAYLYGRGVAESRDAGLAWYRRAAANGHPGAQRALQQLAAADRPQVAGSEWIRAQPGQRYTVQLLAAEDETGAQRFIAGLPPGDYAVAAYHSRHKRWFAVVSGSFGSAAEAARAAARWSSYTKPWVREFRALQQQLGQ